MRPGSVGVGGPSSVGLLGVPVGGVGSAVGGVGRPEKNRFIYFELRKITEGRYLDVELDPINLYFLNLKKGFMDLTFINLFNSSQKCLSSDI